MGLFDFIVDVSSAAVKVAITPATLVVDIGTKVVTGENPGITSGYLESAKEDLESSMDNLLD